MAEARRILNPVAVAPPPPVDDDGRRSAYREARAAHWNRVARTLSRVDRFNGGYHARIEELYRWLIPPGQRVLELGCGPGDLLAAVSPAYGVGVDFAADMLAVAAARHPALSFVAADVHELDLGETFDYIILSDVINDLYDVQQVFDRVRR